MTPKASIAITQASDEELFQGFLCGEERAFTHLFERHNRKIFYYCAKLLGDPQAAEDITQAMWEKVIDMRAQSQPARVQNFIGLLFRIARNLALDYLKHRRVQSPLDANSELLGARSSHDVELSGQEQIVLECLEALPLGSREVLVLHYYSGYSFEEIAKLLGKKPNAIWTRASRARADLKVLVERRLTQRAKRSMREKETT
ncbi:MAG: RNA polymerase sigma factor [Bacteroidota bacterium]|nr:RNA polymerase sigma factor [Bacteroidota bacterium]MDP4241219.1 RNA polymerase sigma factor [Bacteroidota bacterium]